MSQARYRLVGRVRAGELAEVYRGLRGEKHPVAIELFAEGKADEAYARRRREASQKLKPVKDDRILQDLELGWVRGRLAVVREWVEGVDVDMAMHRLETRDVALPPHVALWIVLQLAGAVLRAQDAGAGRSELLPVDALLTRQGRVALAGFAEAGPGACARSLGEIAFRLLTQREAPPPRSTSVARDGNAAPPRPSEVNRLIDLRIDPIVAAALAARPGDGPCAPLSASIRDFLSGTEATPGPKDVAHFVKALFPNESNVTLGPVPWSEPFALGSVARAKATPRAREVADWEAPPAAPAPTPPSQGRARKPGALRIRSSAPIEAVSERSAPEVVEAPSRPAAPKPPPYELKATGPLTCPGCGKTMHRLFVDKCEIGRCPACGGVWLEFGEIDALSSRAIEPATLDDSVTSRRCASCRITMTPAALPGDIRVETCSACRGLYFDEGELEQVLGRHVNVVGREGFPQPREAGTGFVCVKCHKRFPLREGNVMRGGLACRSCTPRNQTTEGERRAANLDGYPLPLYAPTPGVRGGDELAVQGALLLAQIVLRGLL